MNEQTISIIQTASTIASLMIALFSVWYTNMSRKEFGSTEAIQNIQGILIERYSERKLSSSFNNESKDIDTLRELRTIIHREYNLNSPQSLDILSQFHEKSIQPDTIENKFAYEISLAIQEIGLMILTGSIPMEVVVSSNGYQFIEDWLYCYHLIDRKIRKRSTLEKKTHNTRLKYHRIHGEWLANFSYLYFEKHWDGELLIIFNDYFSSIGINPCNQELEIRRAETQIIPTYIMKKIEYLISN